ncbi:unnamed protein product [Amoebophrya sp. A120]|nr:unnamed protein product [Amoebophrya sp. A120]|eukprot:GSA120T00024276001.1
MVKTSAGAGKWKGRKVMNEEEQAEKMAKKEQERLQRRLADEAEKARKLRALRAKQRKARAAEKEFKERVGKLGVFRALMSGVASMQLRLSFSNWVYYVELLKDERMERYRRQRWQLACGEEHQKVLEKRQQHLLQLQQQQVRDGAMSSTMLQKLKYHVEGDEACGLDLQLKSTHLPQLLPRAYKDPSLPTRRQALVDQLPGHPSNMQTSTTLAAIGGGDGGSSKKKTDTTDSMTLTQSSFTHSSTDKTHGTSMQSFKSGTGAGSANDEDPNLPEAQRKQGMKNQPGGSSSTSGSKHTTQNDFNKTGDISIGENSNSSNTQGNRSMHTTGSSAFNTVVGAGTKSIELQLQKERTELQVPLHQQYGYDPNIMKFKGKGLHYRTGRPVFFDEKYSLFKFVYPHVNKRFFDYGDKIRSGALEYSYEPRGHVMVK